jgi:transposase
MTPYKPKRKYNRDFKLEAVQLALRGDRTIKSVAEDLGIHPVLLGRWRRQYLSENEDAFPGKGRLTPQEEEIRRLKRKLADAEEERDILKKAVAFFAKRSG